MSNVLIGIIGVILFIGLALAGALFLGPRFQEATVNSKASSLMEGVKQVSAASSMAVANGVTVSVATDPSTQLITSGYLKALPTNVITPSIKPSLVNSITGKSDPATGQTADTALLWIGPEVAGNNADQACLAIAKQMGQAASSATTSPSSAAIPSTPTGCFRKTGTTGDLGDGGLFVYSRF